MSRFKFDPIDVQEKNCAVWSEKTLRNSNRIRVVVYCRVIVDYEENQKEFYNSVIDDHLS